MAFGAIFGLRVVRWLLVLRDARLRVGSLEATRLELGRPRGLDSTRYHGTQVARDLAHGSNGRAMSASTRTRREESAARRSHLHLWPAPQLQQHCRQHLDDDGAADTGRSRRLHGA